MTTLAIVHPTHLVAAELRELLDRRRELWKRLELLSTRDDEIGTLTEVRGEAAVVAAVDGGSFEGVDVAFFFGAPGAYRPLLEKLPEGTTAVVMGESPDETDGLPIVTGLNLERIGESSTLASPHPAAVGTALVLHALTPLRPKGLALTVMQPASVFGNAGLDELLEQTRRMLSFQSGSEEGLLPRDLAFNIFAAPGGSGGIVEPLRTVLETTAMGDAARDLALSCQVLQGSVFHGFGLSLHLELHEAAKVDAVTRALDASAYLDLDVNPHRFGPKESVAKEQILVGPPVPAGENRFTLWASFDALTVGGASNALAMLEALSPELGEH